jgi:hypothetical protein
VRTRTHRTHPYAVYAPYALLFWRHLIVNSMIYRLMELLLLEVRFVVRTRTHRTHRTHPYAPYALLFWRNIIVNSMIYRLMELLHFEVRFVVRTRTHRTHPYAPYAVYAPVSSEGRKNHLTCFLSHLRTTPSEMPS